MEYEINFDTLAVYSIEEDKCKIIENELEYIMNRDSMDIIEHSCEYFGSTYYGRHQGTKKLIGVTHKSPIIIEESSNIIFFPTTSPRNEKCVWLSLNNILNYKKGKDNTTIIEFKNGKLLEVEASIGSINNQILRASRLESVLRSRKEKKNKYNEI